MGSHKGPQTLVLCCAASATTAISSRRLDTALLCAAKKRGVELPGWQVSARITLVPGPRDQFKNPPWRSSMKTVTIYTDGACSGNPAATHGRIKKKGGFRRPKTLIHFWTNVHCADIRRRSHVNAGDDAHGKEHCDNRAAAIAEKRERQTDDRENAEAHTDIDDRL